MTGGPGPDPGVLPPLAVRIPVACRLIGIGKSKLYELIAAGEIETIKVGSVTLIAYDALTLFLNDRRNVR